MDSCLWVAVKAAKNIMWSEFISNPDRLVFIACILLGWIAIELVQAMH